MHDWLPLRVKRQGAAESARRERRQRRERVSARGRRAKLVLSSRPRANRRAAFPQFGRGWICRGVSGRRRARSRAIGVIRAPELARRQRALRPAARGDSPAGHRDGRPAGRSRSRTGRSSQTATSGLRGSKASIPFPSALRAGAKFVFRSGITRSDQEPGRPSGVCNARPRWRTPHGLPPQANCQTL
jgi:hypothetical protein